MEKLLTISAAVDYLRERTGSMSRKTFLAEVAAGRIPVKPYGASTRYRKQDLETWLNITETHHLEYTNVAKPGTRASHLLSMGNEWSFAKLLAQRNAMRQSNGAPTASNK